MSMQRELAMRGLAAGIAAILALTGAPARAAAGDSAVLPVSAATIRGGATYYPVGDFIGSWRDPKAVIEWTIDVEETGRPEVVLTYSCAPGNGGDFELSIGNQKLTGKTLSTGDWYAYKEMNLGRVAVAKGPVKVVLKAGPFKTAPMNVRQITLTPLKAKPIVPRPPAQVFIVPNFHPASCGWLANWSVERNYCTNSYLDHLDRVRDDPAYAFVISEVNNMIAILNFEPKRFEELKARIKEGRVEAVNAFFLEPTINLSGGEALVKMGIEGLRWQQAVLGVRPRFCWCIDVTGTHEQMAQITAGLGLEAYVYTRHNPTGSTLHWIESPDGTRTLGIATGRYADWGSVFRTKQPLDEKALRGLVSDLVNRASPIPLTEAELQAILSDPWGGRPQRTPAGAPVLILGGGGDYSLAPDCKGYPSEFLKQFKAVAPPIDVRFSTLGKYVDAVMPGLKSGEIKIPTMHSGTKFSYDSFWIQCPRVKWGYRRAEQNLQAAEMLATAASLKSSKFEYPAQDFYKAWLLMCLNMDRNTLWGAAGGMVFETKDSWDANDRFEWVDDAAIGPEEAASDALSDEGPLFGIVFNPLNWARRDPVVVSPCPIPTEGMVCQLIGDRGLVAQPVLPAAGLAGVNLADADLPPSPRISLPPSIETNHYSVRIDPATGALVSLKLKPSGRKMLGGPSNVIVAERTKKQQGDPGDYTPPRSGRERVGTSGDSKPKITVETGPVATIVQVEGAFLGGGSCQRTMTFYKDYPRIDFVTELSDVPDHTVVVAEFPLAEDITEVRRGIPYGFSHGAWSKPNPALHGWTQGITPAVRWSHYTLAGGGGVAILDRGVTGRELTGRTPILFLLNANEKYYGYPNAWLSGKGEHTLEYALVAHEGEWVKARIPQMAWEFNVPPLIDMGRCAKPQSFLQTSDNVIVEAMRREGNEIELRMAECFGIAGTAEVTVNLPHEAAALTDLVGGNRQPLPAGPTYKFPVRPQQIVTMRLRTATAVPQIKPLLKWDELVPVAKRPALNTHTQDKGHPPRGK